MSESLSLRKIYPGQSILADCWEGKESFRSLVPWHFDDERSFGRQAELLESRAYQRKLLVQALGEQNDAFSGGPAVKRNLDMLSDPRSVAVIGGQQAGLFGGPLYTLYKALTVIALAGHLSTVLRRPAVPIFWIASEDGDLAEVNHANVIDEEGGLFEISLGGDVKARIPVSRIALGAGIGGALAALRAALPDSLFMPELMSGLERIHVPDATYPRAFGAWMRFCMGDRGLVLVDPSDVRLKRIAAPLFRREIEEDGPVARSVLRQTRRMTARGYPQQLELHEDMLTLFYQDPERQAIGVSAGAYELKNQPKSFTRAKLLSLLEESPEKFSPNAALRPLFQDTLFPTVATVLGPAELAYHCQLTEAYARMGIPMPVLFPRASLTIVDPKIAKLLDRHGMDLGQVISRKEGILDDMAKREIPPSLFETLSEGRIEADGIWNRLIGEIGKFDPTLAPTAKNTLGTISKRFEHMEKKLKQAARRKDRSLREHAQAIMDALYPRRGLQERTLSLVSFLSRYGKSVIDLIEGEIKPFSPEHRIVRIAP
jgi:bacillithiol biosynthesis cysteine-adding enzyme BshC